MDFQRIIRSEVSKSLPLPSYARPGDAGLDMRAAIDKTVIVWPFQIKHIPLGWAVEIPMGYVGIMRPRSGHASTGLVMASSGVIDSGYRGELIHVVFNVRPWPRVIRPGERIAQLIISPVETVLPNEVPKLSPSGRGCGGFGHTGR